MTGACHQVDPGPQQEVLQGAGIPWDPRHDTGHAKRASPVYTASSRQKPTWTAQPTPITERKPTDRAYPARQGFLSLGEPTACCAGRKDTVPS